MKKWLLAGTALCVAPFSALAADMPIKAPPPVVVAQVYSWTGFYIGGHVGYGWGNHDVELTNDDHESKGVLGGFQAGYNFQSGRVVFGIEADWSFSGVKSDDRVVFNLGAATSTIDIEHKFNHVGSVRGRLGYAFDSVLAYVTGGWAFAKISSSATAVNVGFGPGLDGTFIGSDSQTHSGWVVGGGLEMAFGGNWSARIEYLHYDFGTERYLALPQLDPTPRTHDPTLDVVRIGLNYRFGASPVVARY